MSRSQKAIRAALVAIVKRDVASLARRRDSDSLDSLTELAGWIWNFTTYPPVAHVAHVLLSIAPIMPLDRLTILAHGAVFHRHSQKGYEIADRLADEALREAGAGAWVDRMNAENAEVAA